MTKFDVVKIINERTGVCDVQVSLNGKQCTVEELSGPIAKSYAGFVSILEDLRDVLAMLKGCHALLDPVSKGDDQDEIVFNYKRLPDEVRLSVKSHFFAAVSLYGRCFVSSGNRGTVLSEKAHIAEPFRTRHAEVMRFRHGLVAHAGETFDYNKAFVAHIMNDHNFHVATNISRLEFQDDRAIKIGFLELVEHLIDAVDRKQAELLQRLLTGQARDLVVARQRAE